MNTYFFDFDSTVITKESLDEMLGLAVQNHPERVAIEAEIERITQQGMSGELDFAESLTARLTAVTGFNQANIDSFATVATSLLTPGFAELIADLKKNGDEIYILSGGFCEGIFPVADVLSIPHENIFANDFVKNSNGLVTGVDTENPLAVSGGKPAVICQLVEAGRTTGEIICIGDGYNDAQAKIDGVANKFITYFGNLTDQQKAGRDKVRNVADAVCDSVEELRDALF